jgi:hypothetical protein
VYSACGEGKYCYIGNQGSFQGKIDSALAQLVDGMRHKSCCNPRARRSVGVTHLAFTAAGAGEGDGDGDADGDVAGGLLDLSALDGISELQVRETIVTEVGLDVEVRKQRTLHHAGRSAAAAAVSADYDFEIRYRKIRGKRRIVSAREAREAISASSAHKTVRKLSYCFVSGGRYYELIQYQQPRGGAGSSSSSSSAPAWVPSWPGCMTLDFEAPAPGERESVLAWLVGGEQTETRPPHDTDGGAPPPPASPASLRVGTCHALAQVGTHTCHGRE